jgi:CreA protein
MNKMISCTTLLALGMMAFAGMAHSEVLGSVDTAWKLMGANHKVVVSALDDPEIPGITCHMSMAKTGGVMGSIGFASDKSKFSIACRQVGKVDFDLVEKVHSKPKTKVKNSTARLVFTKSASFLFKEFRVVSFYDKKRKTIVYMIYSTKLIEGSAFNSISTVPLGR